MKEAIVLLVLIVLSLCEGFKSLKWIETHGRTFRPLKCTHDEQDILKDIDVDNMEAESCCELPEDIKKRIIESSPSDTKMRLEMMGFTPFTKAGFVLGGVILTLNGILGTGWASDLFSNERSGGSTSAPQEHWAPTLPTRDSPFVDKSQTKTLILDGQVFELQ